ncbi:alcohol dehydrogenase catalytic domain-containing protein [Pseudonocardia alni]|uniref:alcohol dehydrogenase n=1 Tax=Pseudonocardia alni TaxID=33907 RepID=A0AA44ULM5_PSEA5|nr:alcohol dehydrogenase catalytic domain-containing protein [Pseudonocardia alni]PKB29490.1 putative phosphonate catabolism associated alcohol dehydrogenase [Pseudonocardia alni]
MAAPVTTARYARWDGVGAPFRLVTTALGAPGPGEVLVAVDLATVCGSDLHTTRGHRSSPVPGVLGHEQVGRVVATAPGLRHVDGAPVRTGDRIVFSVAASCGECRRCRRGIPQKCADLHKYGHAPLDEARPLTGGFATHCLLAPGTATVVVPPAVPDEVAAPASCATATVAAVLDAAGSPGLGTRVLVTGAGMLGVTAAAMASRAGAEVVVADPHADRRARARRFGAADTVGTPPERAFDVALELSGAPAAVRACLDALDVGGTAVLAGSVSPGPAVGLDPERLVRGLHTVVGVHNYAPRHLAAAVAFLVAEHTRFPFAELTGGPWSLDALDDAFAAAGLPGAAPRQAVRP